MPNFYLIGDSTVAKFNDVTYYYSRFGYGTKLDNYFKDISALINEYGSFDKLLESGYDVDSPDNFDMEQLYTDLYTLSTGVDVKIPQYLVNGTGIVVPKAIEKKARKTSFKLF